MIDISQYRLFTHPESIYLDQKGPAFRFDSVIPTSKVEYLAALTISTKDCNRGLLNYFPRSSDLTGGTILRDGTREWKAAGRLWSR